MNQSKIQQNRVELQLPDFISLQRYEKWLENETHKTLQGKLNACEALTLNTQDDIKSIPVEVWEKYYKVATDQLLQEETLTPLLIKYKDETIGINLFSQKTIGEVADTETMLSNGKMVDVARTMLSPVESHEFTDEQWVEYGEDDKGNKILVKYLINVKLDSKKYKAKGYDIDNLLPSDYFEDFPLKLYNGVLDFILRAGIPSFLKTSAPCSKDQQEAMKELFKQMIKIQVGLRQSSILERLTS